jgi:hypothetical protein
LEIALQGREAQTLEFFTEANEGNEAKTRIKVRKMGSEK